MWNTFRKNCKLKGKKYALRKAMQEMCGLQEYQEQIDTLFYFLNKYIDISKIPSAEGNLRLLQQADAKLLNIFHKVCMKNELTYWLDWGTLLGAVRHGGFIPWDDDLDVAMPREDYEKATLILREELAKFGIDAIESKNEGMARIGIGYKHQQTGVWLDVFPMDYTHVDKIDEKKENMLYERMTEYRKFYLKNRFKISRNEMIIRKKEMIDTSNVEIKIWYHAPEFEVDMCTYVEEDIFPLKKMLFEGNEYYVPAMVDNYLKKYYNDYMSFPHNGVEHHGSQCLKLSEWAANSGIDMRDIITELEKIGNML